MFYFKLCLLFAALLTLIHGTFADSGCKCINSKDVCACCVHLELKSIDLNDTGCVNITYLPKAYGISVTFEIDGHVLINETISARNPPPLCAAVPHLKDAASICLDFYDLDVSHHSFTGCLDLEARLVYVLKEKVHLGCWKLGSAQLTNNVPHIQELVSSSWKYSLQSINKESATRRMKLLSLQ